MTDPSGQSRVFEDVVCENMYADQLYSAGIVLSGNLNANGYKIVNLEDPTNALDSVNKQWTENIGSCYVNNNSDQTMLVAINQFEKAVCTTVNNSFGTLFSMPISNRLRYDGTATIVKTVTITGSVAHAEVGPQSIALAIAKNGSILLPPEYSYVQPGGQQNISVSIPVQLAQNDYIELFIANGTTFTPVTVISMTIVIS